MAIDLEQARPFLDALFGNMAADEFFLIWTLSDSHSTWWKNVDEACKALTGPQFNNKDVYAGMCTSHADLGPLRRGEAAAVASMGCLWADIDIGGQGHKKENYPPTVEDAMGILAAYPKPSMVVSTGHGLHVYWLFRERFNTSRPVDNAAAAELSERWQMLLRRDMQARGWTMDTTFDLARILRIPGTSNFKEHQRILPVTLTENNGTRYDWLELSQMIPAEVKAESRAKSTRPSGLGSLKLDGDRVLDGDKMNNLADKFGQKFRDSYDRTKPLPGGDQSASAYDASLAMYGVMAGWDDQAIADILIMSRRKAHQDLKLRQDYYARTIASARAEVTKAEGIEELISQAQTTPESIAAENITEEEARRRQLDSLSTVLQVKVDKIIKYDMDPDPIFWMEIGGSRRVKIGTVDIITEQKKFGNKVLATIGASLPDFKREQWKQISRLIVNCAELAQGITDGRFEDSVKNLVHEYLIDRRTEEDDDVGAATCQPFKRQDVTYIHIDSFIAWIYQTRHMNYLRQDLAQYLTNAGCVVRQVRFTMPKSGKKMSRNFWVVPADLVPGNG